MTALEKNIMRPKNIFAKKAKDREFEEKVLEVSRISRVVKGGRRLRFRALVAVGDRKGRVGIGIGKASEVAKAVEKGTKYAKKKMFKVPIINGTIPYEIVASFGAAKIILKPASPGTSIVAGGAVRNVVELAGITDILAKIVGSKNMINNALATTYALQSFNPQIVEKIEQLEQKSSKRAALIKSKENNPKSDRKSSD